MPGGLDPAGPAGAQPVAAGTPGVTRYFGKGAYDGIRAAVAATPRSCGLSDDDLTALVMAPIFKEVSMAETPDKAPSPMTLSRWDEWSGVSSRGNNLDANFGLYAFWDPHGTPYKRAYWTPGIGIFQYDVAGVGAPFTAAQLMNVEYIAGHVAAGMAQRYCAAPADPAGRRAAAWRPWKGLGGIAKSEALYQEMMGPGHAPFATIGLVEGIDNAGGMLARTCKLGRTETPCHYIDPARAQGANWWATTNVDGGAVAAGEAPLTAPFYVVERNGYEERHWLAEDTGYDVDISARRRIGQNARPMAGQPHSGLEWFKVSDLCDTARPEMGCAPKPKPKPKPKAEPKPEPAPEPEPAASTTASTVLEALRAAQAPAAEAGEPAERDEAAPPGGDDQRASGFPLPAELAGIGRPR